MSKQLEDIKVGIIWIGGAVALVAGILTISTYFNLSKEGTISVFGVILLFVLMVAILRGMGRIETSIKKLPEKIGESIKGKSVDDCNEEEKKPEPTGIGAFGGGAAGAAIGLAGGPIGVIVGGIIGALFGNALECEADRQEKIRRGC